MQPGILPELWLISSLLRFVPPKRKWQLWMNCIGSYGYWAPFLSPKLFFLGPVPRSPRIFQTDVGSLKTFNFLMMCQLNVRIHILLSRQLSENVIAIIGYFNIVDFMWFIAPYPTIKSMIRLDNPSPPGTVGSRRHLIHFLGLGLTNMIVSAFWISFWNLMSWKRGSFPQP